MENEQIEIIKQNFQMLENNPNIKHQEAIKLGNNEGLPACSEIRYTKDPELVLRESYSFGQVIYGSGSYSG